MLSRNAPSLLCHADWGTHERKRWIAKAFLEEGRYTAFAPLLVGDHTTLIAQAAARIGKTGTALLGFDFPIGIPAAYARLVGVADFRRFLLALGAGPWSRFWDVCREPEEISLYRPFYPDMPGGTKQAYLLAALGMNVVDDLRRRCELKQPDKLKQPGRRAACPLFWTLGANQVGKGARVGWKDVIAPSLSNRSVRLWPFDGKLRDLLLPSNVVIAETYPAEYYGWFISRLGSKRNADDRRKAGKALLQWTESANVRVNAEMEQAIKEGFPRGRDDAFDAAIGLFGMLEVVLNRRASGEPADERTRVEGWILGQTVRPRGPDDK